VSASSCVDGIGIVEGLDELLWDAAFATDKDDFLGVFVGCDGIFRMALSCNSTNDSFGSGDPRCGCFPCARGDKCSDVLEACLERCHADLTGEGRCASCSASEGACV
jgi:hypothetical protein